VLVEWLLMELFLSSRPSPAIVKTIRLNRQIREVERAKILKYLVVKGFTNSQSYSFKVNLHKAFSNFLPNTSPKSLLSQFHIGLYR
jgi:hypothetical protein